MDFSNQEFYGILIGKSGKYQDQACLLENKVPVYFKNENSDILVEDMESETALACLYYIPEYQEYCIEPYQMNTVYLKSGQPLGKRVYYLPRGMAIYINEKEHLFKLG
ncbi:hypothetical protein [Thomasclavelia sp.]|uniref:hypothetical protein n=1 Tax=Thomasclavelia sp. TaxID=3025757 RepID=UPI0025E45EAD|nr:hypothetical protein [Thomasclavelia sp.]